MSTWRDSRRIREEGFNAESAENAEKKEKKEIVVVTSWETEEETTIMALVEVNWKPTKRQLRLFGLAGTVVFALLAAGTTAKVIAQSAADPRTATIIAVIWTAICIWTLLAIFRPRYLLPFYLAISAIGLPIGIVVSFAILAVLYFGVFTPMSLVFRLVGRDALHRRFDASAKTYWTPRRCADDVRRYYRQF
jgi:hypothetical protein